MSEPVTGWKIFTHDLRSPIQGGTPVWDGTVPFDLPTVRLDTSDAECAPGWNFTRDIETGFRIVSMWPSGRPSVVAMVTAQDVIARGNKLRAASLRIERIATELEIEAAIGRLSRVFAPHAARMAAEQMAWRAALGRPHHDEAAVREGLERALEKRGLKWTVESYSLAVAWDARAAWDAWAAWTARAAWDARSAGDARAAWTARAAWDARAPWAPWAARAAWATGAARAAWDARDAWAAQDAWAALTVCYASLCSWINYAPDYLSTGLRDAYAAGLAVALPVGNDTLGYAMEKP